MSESVALAFATLLAGVADVALLQLGDVADAPVLQLGDVPTVEQLPGLLVALPIVGAAIALAAGRLRARTGWIVAAVTLALEAALAVWLATAVYWDGSRVVHVLGGETYGRVGEEGFVVGIELIGDALSGIVVLLIATVALTVLVISRRLGPRSNAFYSGYLLLTGGLMGVVLTGDLFNLFVFLEIVGLATYALVASGDDAESAVASLKYLIIGTAGASLYLVGVGYVFVATGTLNMVDVSRSLAGEPAWIEGALYADPLVLASFAFIAAGLLTKAAIFPLHTWQPDAYAEAPDAVTVYVSALVSTAAAYALARITWQVYTPEFFAVTPVAIEVVLALAAISVLAGSTLATMQVRIKRTFAYSSVAQFGLVVLGIGIAVHPAAVENGAVRFAVVGAVIHLLGHAIIKGGLFTAAASFAASTGARTFDDYAGLAKRRPVTAASMGILGLAIVGVPPSIGFLGKWYVGVAAVQAGLLWVVLVIFLSTLLTMLYVARILEKLYFDYRPEDAPAHAEASAPSSSHGEPALRADGGDGHGSGDGHESADGAYDGDGSADGADDGDGSADGAYDGDGSADGAYDGHESADGSGDGQLLGRPLGPVVVAAGVAILAVVLGFAGAELTSMFDPIADAVEVSAPEVTGR